MGEARFTEPKTVQVTVNATGTRMLRGERVFLNLGSRASIPDVPRLACSGMCPGEQNAPLGDTAGNMTSFSYKLRVATVS